MLEGGVVAGIVLGCVIVTNIVSIVVTWFLTKRHYSTPPEGQDEIYAVPPDATYPIQQSSPPGRNGAAPRPSPRRSTLNSPNFEQNAEKVFENHVFYNDTGETGTSSNNDVTPRQFRLPESGEVMRTRGSSPPASERQVFPSARRYASHSLEDLTQISNEEKEDEDEHYITYKTEERRRTRAMSLDLDLSKAIASRKEEESPPEFDSDSDYEHLDPDEEGTSVKEVVGKNSPPPGSYVTAKKPDIPTKPVVMPKPKHKVMNNQL